LDRGSAPDEVPARDGADNGSDLAVKLNTLFEVMRKPSAPQLSNAAAAEAITKATGVSISPAYIWQLRSGLKTNPTMQHLRAIADFFGVPASYLIDREPDQKIEAQLALMQALRDSGVRDLAMRTSGLTPEAISSLAAMVDEVRRLHDLPPMAREEGQG
jgi:transcriptional regulator with XRE-family HTH domain